MSKKSTGVSGMSKRWTKSKRTILTLTAALLLAVGMTGCANGGKKETIQVATKGFAESDILANALKLLIEEKTDLKADVKKLDNNLLWTALKKKEVDTYVEYTGTALINILKADPEYDAQVVYEKVKKELKEKNQITVLDPLGFTNSYAFGVRKEKAEKLGLKTGSDIAAKSAELVFGASEEFMNRPDLWPPILEAYKPKFKDTKSVVASLTYQAIEQGLIDVTMVQTTSAQVLVRPMVVLEDDKHVYVPYYAIPVVRDEVLAKHPELEKVLNAMAGKMTEKEMQRLNGEVENQQRPAIDVAKEWLIANGLLEG
ncbi:glycine betaine ABC transporter substrate-binding protein [Paenibacillus sp. NPDC058071]|uniref:ABC transporter substrate-binding protein n=1 Tax=Paenibacillus sp. NPDC058071 TaxID=3346326 RepID=UPI0036DE26CA